MFQSARSKREGEAHTTNEEPRGLGQVQVRQVWQGSGVFRTNQMWMKLSSDGLCGDTVVPATDGYKQRCTFEFSPEFIGFEQNRRGFYHCPHFQWSTWKTQDFRLSKRGPEATVSVTRSKFAMVVSKLTLCRTLSSPPCLFARGRPRHQ